MARVYCEEDKIDVKFAPKRVEIEWDGLVSCWFYADNLPYFLVLRSCSAVAATIDLSARATQTLRASG